MRITYFISSSFPYDTVIYPGVGPRFAAALGLPSEPIGAIGQANCDAGIIDGRLTAEDLQQLDAFLAGWSPGKFPIFFRISDPLMPTYQGEADRYIMRQKDVPGVHYVSLYDPAGPLLEFTRSLARSKVVRLPFPYDAGRKVERDFASRRRRILLSGARSRDLYPLRHAMHRRRRWNPLVRLAVSELRHPGYPESAQRLRHNLLHERYVEHAAGFTHFFLGPSRFRVELMKFVECAYAGCVPIGVPANSLKEHVRHCFWNTSGKTRELWKALRVDRQEMFEMASEYRRTMQRLRDPAKLLTELEAQLRDLL